MFVMLYVLNTLFTNIYLWLHIWVQWFVVAAHTLSQHALVLACLALFLVSSGEHYTLISTTYKQTFKIDYQHAVTVEFNKTLHTDIHTVYKKKKMA